MEEDNDCANRGMPCQEATPHGNEIRLFTILIDQATKKYRMVFDDSVFSVTKMQSEDYKDLLNKQIEMVNSVTGTNIKEIK